MSKIIPTKVNHLELVKAKLNYYRSISLMDGGIIIEFWKIEQKEGEPKQTPKSRNAEKELAFLTFDKERKLFKVSYYSINDGIQIKENITLKPSHGPKFMENQTEKTQAGPLRSGDLFGSCCFNCSHWIGHKKNMRAYCKRLNISGRDAPHGTSRCVLWEKRANARLPNN